MNAETCSNGLRSLASTMSKYGHLDSDALFRCADLVDRQNSLIGELVAALMSASDALDHTDYLLGDSYNQVHGVKGAIKRGYDVLEKAERAMK